MPGQDQVFEMLRTGHFAWGSYGPGFVPSDVSGLVLWVETLIDLETDIDGVYEITDQSASANDLVQATGAQKPDVVTDHFGSGVPGVQGDGADDNLGLQSNLVLAGDFSLFLVWEPKNIAGKEYPWSLDGTNKFIVISDGAVSVQPPSGTNKIAANGSVANDVKMLLEIHRDGSDDYSVFVNGVDVSSSPKFNDSTTVTRRYLMVRNPVSDPSTMIFGASLAYSSIVTGGDLISVRSYLNGRYNL